MTEQRIEENREGTIIRLQGGFYDVMTPEGEVRSRARGNFRKRGISPVVGDEVVLHIESETGYILEVKERDNFLVRRLSRISIKRCLSSRLQNLIFQRTCSIVSSS